MSTSKKPTLQIGEYAAPQQVEFTGTKEGHHAGIYIVELGAEYKDLNSFPWNKNARRRYVRVDGSVLDMYAMVRETGRGVTDRRILRDEAELNQRAVEWYVAKVLAPKQEREKREEDARQRELALRSTDNWHIETSFDKVTIMPVGIVMYLPNSSDPNERRFDADRARRVAIMERILTLAKRHGLTAEGD